MHALDVYPQKYLWPDSTAVALAYLMVEKFVKF